MLQLLLVVYISCALEVFGLQEVDSWYSTASRLHRIRPRNVLSCICIFVSNSFSNSKMPPELTRWPITKRKASGLELCNRLKRSRVQPDGSVYYAAFESLYIWVSAFLWWAVWFKLRAHYMQISGAVYLRALWTVCYRRIYNSFKARILPRT